MHILTLSCSFGHGFKKACRLFNFQAGTMSKIKIQKHINTYIVWQRHGIPSSSNLDKKNSIGMQLTYVLCTL
jgi:hypothetical protein